jgi:hypothetical protein
VALATGVLDGSGLHHRRARLRALTGRDEALLAEGPDGPTPDDVDALLAATVQRLGGYADDEVGPHLVAHLTRGDRSRLLLTLRATLAGTELRLATACPNPDCPEVPEVVLALADVLALPSPAGPGGDAAVVATAEGSFRVRLPRGSDDAAAAAGAPARRPAVLWARLVERAEPDDDGDGAAPARLAPDDWDRLAGSTRAALAAALADLREAAGDPDLAVVARCPGCGAWLEIEADAADVLRRTTSTGTDRLLAETHCLAFFYGWSEDTILDLPRARRHRYLDLLRRQVEGRPLLDLRR